MTTDICGEEVIVRLSSPQIISTETIVAASSPNNVSGTGNVVASLSGARMQAGGVELGRRLLLAARAGDTAAVLDLMAKGAPFTTDWLGTSPLHLAAANDHVDTCAVLLRAGVSRDSRTKVERTALHLAAHAGHARVVALLLDNGAAVDCRDMLRMTPLHWAAARGHAAAARELLRRGADVRARCKFRKTPRCLAARCARADIVALLDAAEAQAQAQPPDQLTNETHKVEREFETIQRIQDIKHQAKLQLKPEKTIIIESKTEPVPRSMASAAASAGATAADSTPASGATAADSGAAALLRAHGITLLPADRGCTVLTALRSGRTVVLSDAGKLMLKESSNSGATTEPQIILNNTLASSMTNASVSEASAMDTSTKHAGSASAVGTVRGAGAPTVRAVRPGRNVKVVTLSKPHQSLKKIIHPSDLQQVKLVAAGEGGAGGGARRPALKLLLNKVNLQRLLATPASAATGAAQARVTSPLAAAATITQEVPSESMETTESSVEMEQDGDGEGDDSPRSLRQQLAAARAALAAMGAELRACRAKIALYEKQRPL